MSEAEQIAMLREQNRQLLDQNKQLVSMLQAGKTLPVDPFPDNSPRQTPSERRREIIEVWADRCLKEQNPILYQSFIYELSKCKL